MKPIDCLLNDCYVSHSKRDKGNSTEHSFCFKLKTRTTKQRYRPQAQYRCNKNYVTVKHCEIEKHGCEKAAQLLWSLEEDSECVKPRLTIHFFPLALSLTSMTTGR